MRFSCFYDMLMRAKIGVYLVFIAVKKHHMELDYINCKVEKIQ